MMMIIMQDLKEYFKTSPKLNVQFSRTKGCEAILFHQVHNKQVMEVDAEKQQAKVKTKDDIGIIAPTSGSGSSTSTSCSAGPDGSSYDSEGTREASHGGAHTSPCVHHADGSCVHPADFG